MPLLAKINFPREALILTVIYQTLFNAAIKICILLLVLPFLGILPGWAGLMIPVGIINSLNLFSMSFVQIISFFSN